jgi:hypothetical protein
VDQDPRPLPGACLRQETGAYFYMTVERCCGSTALAPARANMTDLTRDFSSLSDSHVELVGIGDAT